MAQQTVSIFWTSMWRIPGGNKRQVDFTATYATLDQCQKEILRRKRAKIALGWKLISSKSLYYKTQIEVPELVDVPE